MGYSFDLAAVLDQWPALLAGSIVTLKITILSISIGMAVGCIGAYQLVYSPRIINWAWTAYVEVIRNTPLLAQIFLIFFGLPELGVRLDPDVAAVLALSLNFGAYAAEIVRAGIRSIPRGQIEAASALALTRRQTFIHVVLRPALAAVYPAIVAQCVLVLLGSAVISAISADDLSSAAAVLQSQTFRPFEVYIVATVIYGVLGLGVQMLLGTVIGRTFKWKATGDR
ncbi:amino acid ABC transporter permease [Paraburkholderia fynbosensis]|nr:amino acid ABC transporter permease [Paraburkholderia fynbosensis]